MMKLSGTGNRISLAVNGRRCGVRISAGPWVEGVNPETIKIRSKKHAFPAEFAEALEIENKSNSLEDYFEKDSLRLLPGHPLYAAAKALA